MDIRSTFLPVAETLIDETSSRPIKSYPQQQAHLRPQKPVTSRRTPSSSRSRPACFLGAALKPVASARTTS